MFRFLSIACLVLVLGFAGPAAAQKKSMTTEDIDFGAYTCKQFLNELSTASEEDAAFVLIWLDGYLSGLSGDTILKWAGFERFAEELYVYCESNGNRRLLDAARTVGIE